MFKNKRSFCDVTSWSSMCSKSFCLGISGLKIISSDSERSLERLIKCLWISLHDSDVAVVSLRYIIMKITFSKARLDGEQGSAMDWMKRGLKGRENNERCWPRWQVPLFVLLVQISTRRDDSNSFPNKREKPAKRVVKGISRGIKQINTECSGNLWREKENDSTKTINRNKQVGSESNDVIER